MYQGLLRSIPLFGALPDEELSLLAERLTRFRPTQETKFHDGR